MPLWVAIALGALQGLTEFLPVSSSGHLVIGGDILGGSPPPRSYDIAVHLGTLVAVIAYYRRDILPLLRGLGRLAASPFRGGLHNAFESDEWVRLVGLLLVACIPTAIIGAALDHVFEDLFASTSTAAAGLFVTAAVLMITDLRLRRSEGTAEVRGTSLAKALLIGTAQGIAVVPGVSRSGSVLSAGVWTGLSREFALRFGFLLSIPAILGAAGYEVVRGLGSEFVAEPGAGALGYLGGALAAACFGYLAIVWLFRATRRGRLWMFGVYCVLAGIVGAWAALR